MIAAQEITFSNLVDFLSSCETFALPSRTFVCDALPLVDERQGLVQSNTQLSTLLQQLSKWARTEIGPGDFFPKAILGNRDYLDEASDHFQTDEVSDKGVAELLAIMPYAAETIEDFAEVSRIPSEFVSFLTFGDLRRCIENKLGYELAEE